MLKNRLYLNPLNHISKYSSVAHDYSYLLNVLVPDEHNFPNLGEQTYDSLWTSIGMSNLDSERI